MNALVIDDSRAMRGILSRILKEVGFTHITEAADGCQGLAAIAAASQPPHLVLVDWNMPVTTGIEFVAAVRAVRRFDAVPLMMVTTESESEQVVKALTAGANEYVMKPFTPDVIRGKLEMLGVVPCPT